MSSNSKWFKITTPIKIKNNKTCTSLKCYISKLKIVQKFDSRKNTNYKTKMAYATKIWKRKQKKFRS